MKISVGSIEIEYETGEKGAIITGYRGSDSKLEIPESIEGSPVIGIEKKAFLGMRAVRCIVVPKTVTGVGDWAFSQCIHLDSITFKGGLMENPGKGIFEGCERLRNITYEGLNEDSGFILATLVKRLPAGQLQRANDIGTREWFERYDLSLFSFLKQDDIEGYSNRALCGEEDISYDGIGSVDGELLGETAQYIKEVGKNKNYLCFFRLKYNSFLKEDMKHTYEEYIKGHGKGKQGETAWLSLKEDFKEDTSFFELYMNIVKPDTQLFNEMISDMDESLTQAKAYLLKLWSGKDKTDNFFDELSL